MELTLAEALQKGIEAHKAGEIQEAKRLYTAILKAQPQNPDANHNLGLLSVGLGKVQEALPFFHTALENNPNISQYWLSYIDTLINLGRLADAQVALQKARGDGANSEAFFQRQQQLSELSSNPQDPPQEKLQSIINLFTLGQKQQALNHATEMLKKFPNSVTLYNIAGASNAGLMQFDAAIGSYKEALRIKPDFAEAYNNMGLALKNKGAPDTAIDNYKKAVLIKPDFAEAYNNMGNAFTDRGDPESAISSFKQALQIKPDFAEAYNNIGLALNHRGDSEGAIINFKRAIKIKPDFAESYFSMGNTLQEKGDTDAAIACYEQAIMINPNYAEASNNMGAALNDRGDSKAAIDSYKKAVLIKPDYAEAYYNMGNALKDKGDSEAAIDSYNEALRIMPNHAEAHNNLGSTLTALGRLEQGKADCKLAIALKPDFAIAHSNLGIIHYLNGDVDSALKSMKKSNEIDPKSQSNGLLLAVVQARKARDKTDVSAGNIHNPSCDLALTTNPLILNRPVEGELIANLSTMNSRTLDKTKDARFGNGRCSSDFNLFGDERSIIKIVAEDLISIMKKAVNADIYVFDSFFNIIGAGGGSTPHNHLKGNTLDEDHRLDLANRKYSLVYYLSVGDQSCNEPGILKLYDPIEDILPCEGMIVIIPASRNHSAVYGGEQDRVMIGANFYIL